MIRRIRPATAEPAIMGVRAEDRDSAAEERRAVTMGVTIWERKEISWLCCTLHGKVKKKEMMNGGERGPRWVSYARDEVF